MTSGPERRAGYELAHLGDAIGDPSRAAMLVALMGGVAMPASELARIAGVAPSTATTHLQRLTQAGLVVARTGGRHRYFRLSGPEIADAIEHLVSSVGRGTPRRGSPDEALVLARTCYAHLAGRVAVAFWARAADQGWVRWTESAVALLPKGLDVLMRRGLLADARLPLAGKACLDWTERVPHVSGRLGLELCAALRTREWVKPITGSRALRITSRGQEELAALGVRL